MINLEKSTQTKILKKDKEIEKRAVLDFNKKLLMCGTYEEMYHTVLVLKNLLEQKNLEFRVMFPISYGEYGPDSDSSREICKLHCSLQDAITECEAYALKFEERVELVCGELTLGSTGPSSGYEPYHGTA